MRACRGSTWACCREPVRFGHIPDEMQDHCPYIPTFLQPYIPGSLHPCSPTFLLTYLPTSLHPYFPTSLHPYFPTSLHPKGQRYTISHIPDARHVCPSVASSVLPSPSSIQLPLYSILPQCTPFNSYCTAFNSHCTPFHSRCPPFNPPSTEFIYTFIYTYAHTVCTCIHIHIHMHTHCLNSYIHIHIHTHCLYCMDVWIHQET